MVNLEKYNPCNEYINYLEIVLSDAQKSDKQIVIKYDKAEFITNQNKIDIPDFKTENANTIYNDKNLLVVEPKDILFIEWINACPVQEFIEIDDIQICGIIKRMYAQIEFGYYCNNVLLEDEISICDNIFKSIYTVSISIKRKNINECIDKYNELQKQRYANKKVIDGIIYAAYDLYNSLNK